MELCRVKHSGDLLYAFFDAEQRLVEHPTNYMHYLERIDRNINSRRQIAYVIKNFLSHIERSPYFSGMKIDAALPYIAEDHILLWIKEERASVEERTIHNREALVREMFNYLMTKEAGYLVKENPWITDKLITKAPHAKLPRYVTADQLITLLNGFHNESQRAAVHFMYDTGVRVSELCRITNAALPDPQIWSADFLYLPMRVPGSKARDGSDIKERDSIITKAMLTRIRKYQNTDVYVRAKEWSLCDPRKPIFLSVKGERLTEDGIRKAIYSAAKRQGLNPRDVSPHRLRHGTGLSVLCSEHGKELIDNLIILKGMLGHADISTTQLYSHTPIAVIQKKNIVRYQEASRILETTYLRDRFHTEKRGHGKRISHVEK